jgi:hypothetical protein
VSTPPAVANTKHKGTGVRIPFVVNRFAQGFWVDDQGAIATLVTPGKPVILRTQLKGVAIEGRIKKAKSGEKPLEIKFEVYAATKPFRRSAPVDDPALPLTAELVEFEGLHYAQATWTPDENTAGIPKEIVFCPRADGLGEIVSESIAVAQQWVLESRWTGPSCLVGSEVDLLAKIHGIKASETVEFRVGYVCDVSGDVLMTVLLPDEQDGKPCGKVVGEAVPANEEVLPGISGECRDQHGQVDPNKKWYRVKDWKVPTPDKLEELRESANIPAPSDEEEAEIREHAKEQRALLGIKEDEAAEGLLRPETFTLRFEVRAGADLEDATKHVADEAFIEAKEQRFFFSL